MAYSELIAEGLFLVTKKCLVDHCGTTLQHLNSSRGSKALSISKFDTTVGHLVLSQPYGGKRYVYIDFTPNLDDNTKDYRIYIDAETITTKSELLQLIKEKSEILSRILNI